MSSNNSEKILTKKDINNVYRRWLLTSQICWNYETMQSGGVVTTLGPALRKIYEDDEEYKKSLHSHFQFFNTQPWMGGTIMGAVLAVEENRKPGEDTSEIVSSIKTGLMGPFAGMGDATFFVIPLTIFGAIASYMALDGSPLGLLLGLVWSIAMLFVRKQLFNIGYNQGIKFVTGLSSQIKQLTESISILGFAVIGALIATNVNIISPFEFASGEVSIGIQTALDMILPKLLAVGVTAAAYYLLGKLNSTKVILLVIIFSIIFGGLGIFAAA